MMLEMMSDMMIMMPQVILSNQFLLTKRYPKPCREIFSQKAFAFSRTAPMTAATERGLDPIRMDDIRVKRS